MRKHQKAVRKYTTYHILVNLIHDWFQIDSARMGGVNEVLAVYLMAAKLAVPVCPHAGGVGLCEMVQHLQVVKKIMEVRKLKIKRRDKEKININKTCFQQVSRSVEELCRKRGFLRDICCVFGPAFRCCAHPKAGQNTFFSGFQPFLFILNRNILDKLPRMSKIPLKGNGIASIPKMYVKRQKKSILTSFWVCAAPKS